MSVDDARWRRLPPRLRPLAVELPGSGELRLIETTLLLLVGLVLTIATVNDLVRETHVNQRLIADERTWRAYTAHDYHNLLIDQELLSAGQSSVAGQRDVVCGNTSPGPPQARIQICLVISGSATHGRRMVAGGWYLPAYVEDDVRAERYGCFGLAAQGLCPR